MEGRKGKKGLKRSLSQKIKRESKFELLPVSKSSKISKKKIKKFGSLIDAELVLKLPKIISQAGDHFKPVATALTYVLLSGSSFHAVMRKLIEAEVEACEGNILFRGESFSTNMFGVYARTTCQKYAKRIFGEFHATVEMIEKADITSREVSLRLWLRSQKVFNGIVLAKDEIPKGIIAILRDVNEVLKTKEEDVIYRALGSFLFLRFYCCALVNPHKFQLVRRDVINNSRDVVVVAKILQNLANGTLPGEKERCMEGLNEFVNENQEALKGFYRDVLAKNVLIPKVSIPKKVLNNALHYLFEFVQEKKNDLEDVIPAKMMALFTRSR